MVTELPVDVIHFPCGDVLAFFTPVPEQDDAVEYELGLGRKGPYHFHHTVDFDLFLGAAYVLFKDLGMIFPLGNFP